jgi:hypothetical protein
MMKRRWRTRAAAEIAGIGLLVGFLVTAPRAQEQEGKKQGQKLSEKSDMKKFIVATTVDFPSQLGLSFDSLRGLGARIEQARTAADPVGLANAAAELSIAEKVSGKEATIKSSELMKAAAEMARYRNQPDELKAVAMLITDDSTKEGLKEQAAKAEKLLAERKGKEEERPRGIENELTVVNHTAYYVSIYVNFNYRGTIAPHSYDSYYVGELPYETTYLYARAPGTAMDTSKSVSGRYWNLTWNLY